MPGGSTGGAGDATAGGATAGGAKAGGAKAGTPGGKDAAGDGAASGDGAGSATTAEERRTVLDKRLDDSLGTFDKQIRSEQERTAQERDSRAASGAGSGSASGDAAAGNGPASGSRPGDLRSEGADSREAATNAAKQGDKQDRGTIGGAGSGGADRGIPSGDDDDIIARRLRRAAEQETDPELKEKLWKEYVEYKRGAQGKT